MTGFTKMSISPTKPLSCRTTKFAFELNKIFTMFRTILNRYLTTVWANKFLSFKLSLILGFIHRISTIFSTTKIWIFAFIAQKICIYCHRIFIRLLIIRGFRINKLLIFQTLLKFEPFI